MSRLRWLPAIVCGLAVLAACSRPASFAQTPQVLDSPAVASPAPSATLEPGPSATPRQLPTLAPTPTITPTPTLIRPTQASAQALPTLGVGSLAELSLLAQAGRGEIGRLAVSGDGKTLALGTRNGVILYDPAKRSEVNFLATRARPTCLAFSPDGRWLAAGLENGRLVGWRVGQYGKAAFELQGNSGPISALDFSPDSVVLAGGDFERVFLWPLEQGKSPQDPPLFTLNAHDQAVRALDFTSDGKYLLSAGGDGILRVWTVKTGKLYRTMYGHKTQIFSAGYTPAAAAEGYGGLIVSTAADGQLRLWLASNGSFLREFTAHETAIWQAVFSPDGRSLLTAAEDGSLRLWQLPTTRVLLDESKKSPWNALPYREIRLEGRAYSAAFSPDGSWLAAASPEAGAVQFWDVRPETPQLLGELEGFLGSFSSAAISPDGRWVAGGQRQRIQLWDTGGAQLRLSASLEGAFNRVFGLAFSPDGSLLASAGGDHRIILWRTQDGQRAAVLEGHNDWVWSVAFAPSGRLLASGSQDGTLRLWHTDPPESAGPERILQSGRRPVLRVAFSPDSLRVAASFVDGMLEVYSVLDGTLQLSLQGQTSSVYGLAFSPDGSLLASAASDGLVNIWRVSSGALLHSFQFESWADEVFFIPSGQALGVQGGPEGTLRFYTLEGNPIQRISGLDAPLAGVGLDASGRRLLMASLDGRIWLYGLP